MQQLTHLNAAATLFCAQSGAGDDATWRIDAFGVKKVARRAHGDRLSAEPGPDASIHQSITWKPVFLSLSATEPASPLSSSLAWDLRIAHFLAGCVYPQLTCLIPGILPPSGMPALPKIAGNLLGTRPAFAKRKLLIEMRRLAMLPRRMACRVPVEFAA